MNFSNINYNLYKCFIAVYENKNISRAAKELFITQPNLSRSIKELERHLDVKLFLSHPRGVEPTNEGTELYHKVAPAFVWIDHGEKSVKEFNEKSTGVVRIACVTRFAGYYLATFISKFNKKFPRIQFDIINRTAEESLEMLERNRIDFVLSTLPLNDKGQYEKIKLVQMKEIGVASKSFAKEKGIGRVITREQFAELPYILIRAQESLKKPIAIVDTHEMLFQMIVNNSGVGFGLEQYFDCNHPNDRLHKFNIKGNKRSERELCCLYNKQYINKVTEMFLKELSISDNKIKIAI